MNKLLCAIAVSCLLISCGGNGGNATPEKPDNPSRPSQPETPSTPVDEGWKYYYTNGYVGLLKGESQTVELRREGKKVSGATFEPSDPNIFSVDASGKVTAIAPGLADVVATTSDGKKTYLSVRVYPDGFLKYSNPTGDQFPIVAWGLSQYDRMHFNNMSNAGVNMAFIWDHFTESIANSGKVKLIMMDGSVNNTYKKYNGNSNFGMYNLGDEPPMGSTGWNNAVSNASKVRDKDKTRSCYINFNGTAADSFAPALEQMGVNFLSYDYYPILEKKNAIREYYYSSLNDASSTSLMYAVPLWTFVLSTQHKDYAYPTYDHMRWELYNGLAFGSQAFQYFTWSYTNTNDGAYDYKEGPVMANNMNTQIYSDIQKLNTELQSMAPYLLGAQLLCVMGDFAGTKLDKKILPYPVKSITGDTNNFTVSHFCKNGTEYILLHNTMLASSNNLKVTLAAEVTTLYGSGDPGSGLARTVNIGPGDVVLYKVN